MSYMDDFRHLEIQLKDIKAATNDFSDKPIGIGGFGAVYKGELLLLKGRRTVAFKRLNREFGQGEVEFWKEITMLSELSHENLASLLHFCREGDERILVYEYASRRSLDGYLDKASLTWTQRLNICIGAATGIAYLHDPKKTQQRVLHRDIKSSNILLDDNWTAKISDFGLSKIGPANQPRTYMVSNIVGTPGYCDPMYYETGILSKECDVYSFGVVLFEVMCGRLCCEFDKDKLIYILVHTWKTRYDEDRLDDIIFPDLKQQIDWKSLSTFAAIAMRCLNRDSKKRPNMDEVVKELEVALHHQRNFKQHEARVARTSTSQNIIERFDHLKIRLKDIQVATNNFSDENLIGRGGTGQVYKGELYLRGGKSMVCIKRLDRRLGQGQVEFLSEILFLSLYKHENLVTLLNICDEGGEMILVFDYVSRGSLDRYLSEPVLTWTQRLKICVGVSHALDYLHNPPNKERGVLHRDIKSSNILLDEDWTAKCVKKDRKERPTMAEVMKNLEIALKQQEDFEETLWIKNLVIYPISNKYLNKKSMKFPKGVLVGDGNTWLSILQNEEVCEVISATNSVSADSLVLDNKKNSRFSNVLKGGMYNGFTVKLTTQYLSPKVTYAVNLIFKHNGTDNMTYIPFKFKLDEERYYLNSSRTHMRDDGWLMIELCQFTSYKREHDIGVHFLPLFDITSTSIVYFLEGIEFRPVEYV